MTSGLETFQRFHAKFHLDKFIVVLDGQQEFLISTFFGSAI